MSRRAAGREPFAQDFTPPPPDEARGVTYGGDAGPCSRRRCGARTDIFGERGRARPARCGRSRKSRRRRSRWRRSRDRVIGTPWEHPARDRPLRRAFKPIAASSSRQRTLLRLQIRRQRGHAAGCPPPARSGSNTHRTRSSIPTDCYDHEFELVVGALQIAIVLASVAVVTRMVALAVGAGIIGIVAAGFGLLIAL